MCIRDRHKILPLILLTTFACKSKIISQNNETSSLKEVEQVLNPEDFGIQTKPNELSYENLRETINSDKIALLQAYQSDLISMDSIGEYFEKQIVNGIVPYWYGTPWSFEGHTNQPHQGEIACGYFVSTTLKHMGLNINLSLIHI